MPQHPYTVVRTAGGFAVVGRGMSRPFEGRNAEGNASDFCEAVNLAHEGAIEALPAVLDEFLDHLATHGLRPCGVRIEGDEERVLKPATARELVTLAREFADQFNQRSE